MPTKLRSERLPLPTPYYLSERASTVAGSVEVTVTARKARGLTEEFREVIVKDTGLPRGAARRVKVMSWRTTDRVSQT